MKILVIAPSWIGDLVMSQSLLAVLTRQRPGVVINAVVPDGATAITRCMPQISESIPFSVGHGELGLGRRQRLAQALRRRGYDQCIVLPNSFKSALAPFWAGIPLRTGWRGELRYGLLNDLRVLDKRRLPGLRERFVALALPPGEVPGPVPMPRLRVDAAQVSRTWAAFELNGADPTLALCIGAEFGPAKRWPARHFAEVAAAKAATGWRVLVLGTRADAARAAALRRRIDPALHGRVHELTGRTSLAQALDLLAGADLVVSNDTGLMHIAAALGRNLVVVYGSSSPGFTPPGNANSATLSLNLRCAPCFRRDCRFGHTRCLEGLTPRVVLEAMDDLLLGAAAAGPR